MIGHWSRLSVCIALVGAVYAPAAAARVLVVGRDGATLGATVAAAKDGDIVEVPDGVWKGAVTITNAITLRGTGGTLDGNGIGTVVRVDAPKAVVEKLAIRNSGLDLGAPDACVYTTPRAAGAVIQDNSLSGCGFGVWVHETRGAVIRRNQIKGSETGHRSNRGNGIHLFNAHRLSIRHNVITGGRDGIYVSAVEHSVIESNHFARTRYGVHYMYSWHNTLRSNYGHHNFAGFALMGSHDIRALNNTAEDNTEHGILLRDVEDCDIAGNRMQRNGTGLFVYSSVDNTIRNNTLRHNERGAKFWAGSVRNEVYDNAFIGNGIQIFYVSTKDLHWATARPGNYWSDYVGWDQDNDGVGDRPHRLDSFSSHLTYRYPAAALLLRSPVLELLGFVEQRMPLLRVPTVVDDRPLMKRPTP